MSVIIFGLREAIAKFAAKAIAGRAAATGTTAGGAAIVIAALKAEAPVLTGETRDSIGVIEADEDVDSSMVTIGARTKQDRFYQAGTSRQPPRPYTEDVAEAVDTAVGALAESLFKAAL